MCGQDVNKLWIAVDGWVQPGWGGVMFAGNGVIAPCCAQGAVGVEQA